MFDGMKRLRESKLISTIYHEARLRRAKAIRSRPILIYQMGKVGSSTIVNSLASMKLDLPVFHMHFLNPTNIRLAEQKLREFYGNYHNVNRWALYESRFVLKHLLNQPQLELRIVSLVREPIARNVSSFFQNIDKFVPDYARLYDLGEIKTTDMASFYLRDFHEHTFPITWFDEEMKSVFGIDVFSTADLVYRTDRLFVYRRGSVELLVLRMEDISEVAPQALQRFLGIEGFKLKNSNVAGGKDYSNIYRRFSEEVKFPRDYLEQMYESKYMKHFYNPHEIEVAYSRWESN